MTVAKTPHVCEATKAVYKHGERLKIYQRSRKYVSKVMNRNTNECPQSGHDTMIRLKEFDEKYRILALSYPRSNGNIIEDVKIVNQARSLDQTWFEGRWRHSVADCQHDVAANYGVTQSLPCSFKILDFFISLQAPCSQYWTRTCGVMILTTGLATRCRKSSLFLGW